MVLPLDQSDNPILSFVLVHILSIHYFSGAGVTLAEKRGSEESTFAAVSEVVPTIMYNKCLYTKNGLSGMPQGAKPCLQSTGLSIELLSRLAHYLVKNPEPSVQIVTKPGEKSPIFDNKQALAEEMKKAAGLQLLYALERLHYYPDTSDVERSAVMSGGLVFCRCFPEMISGDPLFSACKANLSHLLQEAKAPNTPALADTKSLSACMRSISLQHESDRYTGRDDALTAMALELLSRCKSPAPMGMQFELMSVLLKAYPYIRLDAILEEVFSHFNRLYKTAFREAIGYFAFGSGATLKYTAADLGSVIGCLNAFSRMSAENSDQQALLRRLIDTYVHTLTEDFCQHYTNEIRQLYHRWQPVDTPSVPSKGTTHQKGGPVFPKRLILTLPGLNLNWNRRGIIRLHAPLSLCLSLMENLLEDQNGGKLNEAKNTDPMGNRSEEYSAAVPGGADALLQILLSLLKPS